jgi:hypothetical protein
VKVAAPKPKGEGGRAAASFVDTAKQLVQTEE